MPTASRTQAFFELMRFNKPVGTLLLLWPTLWALWIAADGLPSTSVLIIFVLGVIMMRAAGCVINDYADRKVDGAVTRTRNRPLVDGRIEPREALILFGGLCFAAFFLVLMTNRLTIALSFGGVAIATIYPFVKRYSHLPQVVLGAAWAWSIPMAFAAQTGTLVKEIWVLYFAVVLWTVAFDTFYAMVDREDDLKIGIKSTAILFGDLDLFLIGVLQLLTLLGLVVTGDAFELGTPYFAGVLIAALLFIYQQVLARHRQPDACFKAFRNNQWLGLGLFIALVIDRLAA
ncbi:4-hydroxybenzoate polyprenyltransferase [Gammaproteobacteria bacterium 54_18_T64]|nr:4-hydroxybenzoate polyprenyltransferase [Gammaproteobacteria bacterium 54_18_T64]